MAVGATTGTTSSTTTRTTTATTDKPAATKLPTGATTPSTTSGSPSAAGAAATGNKPPATGTAAADQAAAGATHPDTHSTTAAATVTSTDGTQGAGHTAEKSIVNPPRDDPRFKKGTTGPVVPEGQAPTVTIPDGKGFGGVSGREQNANDKRQNNYSVTDANFNPQLGLMAKDPDTGKEMTYVQHIQTYNAAGYIRTFAKDTWNKLVDAQNAGDGVILEGSAYLMGLTKAQPTWFDQYGITGADIPDKIPGTNRDARAYVMQAQDATGQDWARMHHPESAWDMYKSLTDLGVGGEQALRLAGDDGVSGAGRLNGYNNQDGQNGFNAGEVEIWKEAALLQQQTGLPIIQAMMSGHDHTGLDASAMTQSNANKLLGLDPNDTSASPARAQAVFAGLLDGTLDEPNNNNNNDGGNNNNGGGGGQTNPLLPALDYRTPSYFVNPADLAGDHGPIVNNPQPGDARFVNGSVGPVVPEGQAQTIKIADGRGFFGLEGRQQNANDKKQNNYSVTDANFNPMWGLLAGADGQPLNYVQQIQLYHAAAYLKNFAPELYELLVALQNQGGLTILEAAGFIMGMFDSPEAIQALGRDKVAQIQQVLAQNGIGQIGQDARIPVKIPGTNMDARAYVTSPKDATGQDWARMHHPESAMEMLRNLLAAGVPPEMAFVLAGDDAVSGAGRLNGYNNQDGNDSFNADEAAVFRLGAEYERQTGIPIVQLMMSGHDHTGLDASAKTKPKINEILGLPLDDVSASPQRAALLAQALLASDPRIDIANLDQHQLKNDYLTAAMTGALTPIAPVTAAATGAGLVAGGGAASGAAAGAGMLAAA